MNCTQFLIRLLKPLRRDQQGRVRTKQKKKWQETGLASLSNISSEKKNAPRGEKHSEHASSPEKEYEYGAN